jgi:hypothetical protein
MSAQEEIRVQMEQAFELVSAANDQIRGLLEADENLIELEGPKHLLDMAEEKLGDHEYLNVAAPHPRRGADVVPIRPVAQPEHPQ